MGRLLLIGGLFVLAGLCEIGGGYLEWGWMREHRPVAWALIGALVLAAYQGGGGQGGAYEGLDHHRGDKGPPTGNREVGRPPGSPP